MRGRILVTALLFVTLGCRSHESGAARPALEVADLHWEPLQWGVKSVGGWVSNHTHHPFERVAIAIEYSDEAGKALGVHELTLRALQPHERRKFSTWLLPGSPTSYRLTKLTGD